MKKFLAFGLLATSLVFADVKQPETEENVKGAHGYVSLGVGPLPLPIPLFGIGGRFQNGHHGADISLQGVSFGRDFNVLKENIDYLYFFQPKQTSQFYLGFGVSATEIFSKQTRPKCQSFLAPQLLVGKQYTNDNDNVRFFQVQIEPVFLNLNKIHKKKYWGAFPAVVFSYGLAF